MRFGLPHVIISDCGREFNNAVDSHLAEQLGIKWQLTTPYHPQVYLFINYAFSALKTAEVFTPKF